MEGESFVCRGMCFGVWEKGERLVGVYVRGDFCLVRRFCLVEGMLDGFSARKNGKGS